MKMGLFIFCIVIAAYAAFEVVRMSRLISVSSELMAKSTAFEAKPVNATERILIVGDSLGVGVGASAPEKSIAGLISADHPQAEIANLSVSGSKIRDGLQRLQKLPADKKFDIVYIQLGANDIVRLTKLSDASADLHALLELAKAHSDKVIYAVSGDVGYAPLFQPPLNWYYDRRSRAFFEAFKKIAEDEGVQYVDFYYPRARDPFPKDPSRYYAPDSFHLTDAGYAFWYRKIKEKL